MNMASLVKVEPNPNIPVLRAGDNVRVSVKVVEGDKERIQVFQGAVIKVRQGVDGGSFTVRHVSRGIGVERTFLFRSPLVDRVEVVRHAKVRRAKLYYLRQRSGKAARLRERRVDRVDKEEPQEQLEEQLEEQQEES